METNKIQKQSSIEERVARLPLGPVGFNSLKTISGYIYEESKRDLRWPKAYKTYTEMAYDSTIRSALNLFDVMIGRIAGEFKCKETASEEVKSATEFLNWCKSNMDSQTWEEFINEVGSYRQYGFHVSEKVYTQVKRGKWQGRIKWKKLPARGQDSIAKWKFDDKNNLIGLYQQPSLVGYQGSLSERTSAYVEIPRNKFMLFRYDAKKDNPEGNSPLKGCYTPWKYKTIIEEYEAIGVAKDLGGIPVIGVPVEYLNRASDNPDSAEAKVIRQMQTDAANLHAGEQSYIMKPVSYDEKGKELFTFDLVGVDGGGKQYNTDDIIRRKQNEMLTAFLADILKLGQDGSGSFALSDNKTTLLSIAVESHLKIISSVINKDLVPQTLALNGWFFEQEDMPYFSFEEVMDKDLDVLSKFLQRALSTGGLSADKGLEAWVRKLIGAPELDYSADKVIPEDFKPKTASRAGDGMKTAGEGTGNSVSDDPDTGSNDS